MSEPLTYGRAVAVLDSVMGDDWMGIYPDAVLKVEAARFFLASPASGPMPPRYRECAAALVFDADYHAALEEAEAWTDCDNGGI